MICAEGEASKNDRKRGRRMTNDYVPDINVGKIESDDLISREAVDEYITNLLSGYLHDEERTRLEDLSAFVWELPSVQPTRPTARWERFAGDYNKCSKCGKLAKFYFNYEYCPGCGAKMQEVEE